MQLRHALAWMTWGEDTFTLAGDQANGYNELIFTFYREITYINKIYVKNDIGSKLALFFFLHILHLYTNECIV